MKIACSKCGTAYEVDGSQVPSAGLRMRCTVCFESFSVMPPAQVGGGIELDVGLDDELELTNDPHDIPAAPSGYVNPTGPLGSFEVSPGFGSDASNTSAQTDDFANMVLGSQYGSGDEVSDLPGLPAEGRAGEIADLPGLPRRPAPAGIVDLPGLPSGAGKREVSDLPGLVGGGGRGFGADLPGLGRGRGGAPLIPAAPSEDLPGATRAFTGSDGPAGRMANRPGSAPLGGTAHGLGPEVSDLPGLPTRGPSGEVSGLPGLPTRGPSGDVSGLPGLPSRRQQDELSDLPGLPTKTHGGGLTDLPGLPQYGAPAELADLPGLPQPGLGDLPGLRSQDARGHGAAAGKTIQGPGVGAAADGLEYGQINMGANEELSLDLDDMPFAGQGRAGGSELVDLPTPANVSDLPVPVNLVGLPAPRNVTDLPRPVSHADAGLPGGTIDQPQPVDLLQPVPGAGRGHAPRDSGPAGPTYEPQAYDVGEVLTFERPPAGAPQKQPTAQSAGKGSAAASPAMTGTEEADDEPSVLLLGSPEQAPGKRVLPKRLIVIGGASAAVMLIGVALGLFTPLGFFGLKAILGGGGGKANGKQVAVLKEAKQRLSEDTYAGYRRAQTEFETGAGAAKGDERVELRALAAQAAAASALRFGQLASRGAAENLLASAGKPSKPNIELDLAEALLLAVQGKAPEAASALSALSERAPKHARVALFSGWVLLKLNRRKPARAAFQRALTAMPSNPGALFGLAQLGSPQLATTHKLVERVLAANPQHADALILAVRTGQSMEPKRPAKSELARLDALMRRGLLARSQLAEYAALSGELAVVRGEIDSARSSFEKALRIDPQHFAALVGLGELALAAKQSKRAATLFGQARAQRPGDRRIGLLLAEAMLAAGKPMDARDATRALAKRYATDPRVQLMLGRVEQALGALEQAVTHYREATKLDPKLLEGYLCLSRLYLEKKEPKLAFGILMQARTELHGAALLNALGEAYRATGELEKAQAQFEKALELDSKFSVAIFNLAATLRQRGQPKAAQKQLQRLAKRDGSFPGLYAAMGAVHLELKEFKAAASAYHKALVVIERPSAALRVDAARAFIASGAYDQAVNEAKQALVQEPLQTDARAVLAMARLGKGETEAALEEIQRAVARKKSAELFEAQAQIEVAAKRIPDAVTSYGEAIKLAPKRNDLRVARAELQVRAGAVRDGLKGIAKVLASEPKYARALFLRGLALADLRDEAGALRAYGAAVANDPELGEAHFRLAQMLEDRRNNQAAWKHLQQAVKVGRDPDPWLPDALFALGRSYQARRNRAAAIAAFHRYLKLAPKSATNRHLAQQKLSELGVTTKPRGTER